MNRDTQVMLDAAYSKHTYISYGVRGCVHPWIDYMSSIVHSALLVGHLALWGAAHTSLHLHRCIHRLLHVNWTGSATYHVFIVIARSIFVVHLPRNGVAVFDSKLEGVEEGASDCVRRWGAVEG